MERRKVPYARPAGRQANATQEAFARARSVWPRLDSTTGSSRGRTSSPDLVRGCPKPTCAGPPGRARACRILCGLTLASSLFLFFLTAYFLSLILSLRPFPHPSRFVHFPPSLSFLHSFFFLLLASFPFFFFFFLFLSMLFFLSFSMDSLHFSRFRRSSLFSVEFLHVSLRTSCSSLFFLANFFDVETRYILVSSFSLFGLRVLPPLLFYLLLRRCYTWFTLSLESVRATKMRWPRRPKESRGADSGVSNEGSCRSRDIAANRTAKWNSN